MAHTIPTDRLEFIKRQHPYVNSIYADELLHGLGLCSYVDKARTLATVDVDHVWQGNRYWLTSELIDAGQRYLAGRAA